MEGTSSRSGSPAIPDGGRDRSMVVACDKCGSKYKLDEARITGRGARVTCPKCKHVFVVYREERAPEPPAAEAFHNPGTTEHMGFGGAWEVKPPAATPAPVVEPPPAPPAPAPKAALPPLDVHSLDFRKVGIQSWKVKVKIGLVYDFSDYKTLAKYISDGRIVPTDLITYTGGEWKPIGTVGNLEQHFIEVYRTAEAALAAPPPPPEPAAGGAEDYESDDPTNIVGMSNVASTITAEVPKPAAQLAKSPTGAVSTAKAPSQSRPAEPKADYQTQGNAKAEATRFVDPFEQRRKEKSAPKSTSRTEATVTRPPPPPVATAEKGGSKLGLVLVGLLLLGGAALGGGYLFLQGQGGGETPPAPTPTPAPQEGAGAPSGEDVRKDVNGEIEKGLQPVTPETQAAQDEAFKVEGDQELIPVGPRGGSTSGSSARRDTPPPSGGSAPPPSSGGGQTSSAADHAAVGDAAMRSGDYAGGATAFRNAVSADPGNGTYNGKLGECLVRTGQGEAAIPYLNKAAGRRYMRAERLLGDVYKQQGDTAGAITHYQKYLASNPPDAAEVQAEIARLQGGG